MQPDLRVLTVTSFGEKSEDDLRITLCGQLIKMIAARDTIIQNRAVKETTILFIDSESVTLNLSEFDLIQIESVVGSYGFCEI